MSQEASSSLLIYAVLPEKKGLTIIISLVDGFHTNGEAMELSVIENDT